MTKRFAAILLVALVAAWVGILFTAGDSTAQLYRYTDKNGRTVFTDNPPPGVIVYPADDEKVAAPEKNTSGEVSMPTPGAKPSPQPQAGREPAAPVDKDREAEMKRVADEEIQKKQEEVQRKQQERQQQEKQQDKQRRLEEADRLEKEAKQPVQPTQENIDRQRKLMEEAQRLREMP